MSKRPKNPGKAPEKSKKPKIALNNESAKVNDNIQPGPSLAGYTTGSSESEQEGVESQARRRNAPYFSWENQSGDRVPYNSAEAVQNGVTNIKYTPGIPNSAQPPSQLQGNEPADNEADDWKKTSKSEDANAKMFSPYDAENPVVEESPQRRNDIMDIRQRLKKCFRVVHGLIVASGVILIIAGCLIEYIDSQMLGNLELSFIDVAKRLYIGSGGGLIAIAVLAQIVLSFQKFKILTWLIYLLLLCVAASTGAACSFTSLKSYKNHNQARTKLFELMNAYNGKLGKATEKWDILHQGYACCGVDNFMDWTDYPYGRTSLRTPMSCCRNFEVEKDLYCGQNLLPKTDFDEADKYVYAKGCIDSMMKNADIWYLSSGLVAGFITIFIGLHWLFCFFLITSHRL
jgi:hypothetical protein